MIIQVQIFDDEVSVLDHSYIFATKSKGYQDLHLWSFKNTYKTSLKVQKGDLVVVPVHRKSGYDEIKLAVVREVEDAKVTEDDYPYPIKSIYFKLEADTPIQEAVKAQEREELLKKMEKRAKELDQIKAMRKYAEDDEEMRKMIDEYDNKGFNAEDNNNQAELDNLSKKEELWRNCPDKKELWRNCHEY